MAHTLRHSGESRNPSPYNKILWLFHYFYSPDPGIWGPEAPLPPFRGRSFKKFAVSNVKTPCGPGEFVLKLARMETYARVIWFVINGLELEGRKGLFSA
jgi:hypothetical protein